ncbi:hypothetical protein GPA10_03585 [Streptomyces sp. p1417]|uniref:Bifunctional DNA primase/polymerase, N-terminal n=1 Tax=Streptomyces typhae TaxID=2681492 RepID=A0A6L6WPE9_9ACTN|nr:hypothetical protein [Streptomyces typhae]
MAGWAEHGVALLPLGVRFDALRVPGRLVHTAVGSDEPATVGAALRDWLHGPVVRDVRTGDGSGCYYALVAPYALCTPCAPWEESVGRLGAGTYLGVPRIGSQVSPVTFWAVRPEHPGHLCDPIRLAALLSTAETLDAVQP